MSTDFIIGDLLNSLLLDVPFDLAEFLRAFDDSLVGVGRRRRVGKAALYVTKRSVRVSSRLYQQICSTRTR